MDASSLPALVWFARVAHHRSFTKAAAELGVSRPAVSQSLKALERQLGVKLLYRTTRNMSLTEDGQRLLDAIASPLGMIERALQSVDAMRGEPVGLLRVNTSRIAARVLVEPHLGEFLARYPQLKLELVIDDGLSNIIADGCDAGIRLGRSLAGHMVAVSITPALEMAIVGAPDYFRRRGKPATPEDLVRHECLRYRYTSSGAIDEWRFTAPGPRGTAFTVHPEGCFTTNDDADMLQAALQGVGLIQHMEFAVRYHLDDGSLVRVLQPWCRPFAGFYLYVPSRDMPPKVRAFRDFLVNKYDTSGRGSAGQLSTRPLKRSKATRQRKRRR